MQCFDEFFNVFFGGFCHYFDYSIWHVLDVAFNVEFSSHVLHNVAVANSLNHAMDCYFESGELWEVFFLHCCLPSIVSALCFYDI